MPLADTISMLPPFAWVGVATFVLREAWRLYRAIDGNVFVGALLARLPDQVLFVFDGRPFTLSVEGIVILAVLLFIMLASFGIRIAMVMIRAGSELLVMHGTPRTGDTSRPPGVESSIHRRARDIPGHTVVV